jgi:arylsulfatase A-like enzyme
LDVALSQPTPVEKLNVLFIAVDDLRPELACYGHPIVKTPNIDRLASVGLRFNRAYCQFALCNPSRSSLLTGRRPESLKVYTLAAFVRDKNPDVTTLPQLFKDNGYATRSFGKIFHVGNGNHDDPLSWSARPWHTARDDGGITKKKSPKSNAKNPEIDPDAPDHSGELPYGDPDVPDEDLIDGQIARHAVAALKDLAPKPFFLAVGFHRPHLPFIAPKKYWDYYSNDKVPLATNTAAPVDAPWFASNDASELRRYKSVPAQGPVSPEMARRLIHGYYASVSYVDAQIGLLLAELDHLNLRSNTVIVLFGDHGYQLGEHGTWTKRTNWELATRAPLLISAPGPFARGKQTDGLVEFVDIFPTLAELCQLPLPSALEGTSLSPLLRNPERSWKSAAFSMYTRTVPELGKVFGRAMRTDKYRFIQWTAPSTNSPFYELYDHRSDPAENVNIANQPANRELVESLTRKLALGWRAAAPPMGE